MANGDAKLELLKLLEEKQRRYDGGKFYRMFPEEGRYRREAYPKHMAFFALGATKQFRMFLGPNGVGKCCTVRSIIPTPDGPRTIGQLLAANQPFRVWAWDGDKRVIARATAPFEKPGTHDCYRITMADGSWIECADTHRLLCRDGYQPVVDALGLSAPARPASNSGNGRSTRAEDVRRSFGTPSGFLASCFAGFRRCGEQLLAAVGIGRACLPLLCGAQRHSLIACNWDAPGHTSTSIRRQDFGHLSRTDAFLRGAIHIFASSIRTVVSSAPALFFQFLAQRTRQPAFPSGPQSEFVLARRGGQTFGYGHPSAYDAPVVVGANSIAHVEYIGVHKVYDFTVETYHNYVAADLVHHNSESCGGYETVCHLTGRYPDWWVGKRYDGPVSWWAACDTNKTLRESLQVKLIGTDEAVGTGIIPRDLIVDIKYKSAPSGALDYVKVKHISGKVSRLVAKSYEEGRVSFQAADVSGIWLDEEPPPEIYTECVQRFRGHTAGGHIIITETPLKGVSEVFCMFVPEFDQGYDKEQYAASGRAYVLCTWDDIAHITPEERAIKIANCLPHELEARTTGMPGAGGGKIFPFAESSFVVPPLRDGIPPWWPRIFGLDVGWTHPTAVVWLAHDKDTDTIYAYDEHKQAHALPAVHIAAIQARGRWIPGRIDPSVNKTDPLTGGNLWNAYKAQASGLRIQFADNAVWGESGGIYELYQRFSTSRLKVVETCTQLVRELRFYQTDDRNRIIKVNDDLIDALRYGAMSIKQATTKLVADENNRRAPTMQEPQWMQNLG